VIEFNAIGFKSVYLQAAGLRTEPQKCSNKSLTSDLGSSFENAYLMTIFVTQKLARALLQTLRNFNVHFSLKFIALKYCAR